MSAARNKRFYDQVSVATMDGGYEVRLDGRALKTPGKFRLSCASEHVAGLIAAEWDAQEDLIHSETMPVTRLVNVALELTPKNRDKLVAEARAYGSTDLLCYRAGEPASLVKRQSDEWDPVLDWAREQGITLEPTQSIIAIGQPEASLSRIADHAASLNDLDLTLLCHLTSVYGSVVLALAVMEQHLPGKEAFGLSRLDALYQIEQWGEDEEAAANARILEAEVVALCQIIQGDKYG